MLIHDFEISDPNGEQAETFRIDSEQSANWYLRKLANLEAEKQRVTQQAALMVKQLKSDTERLRNLYEADLQEYVRQELARTGTAASRNTSCKVRASSARFLRP